MWKLRSITKFSVRIAVNQNCVSKIHSYSFTATHLPSTNCCHTDRQVQGPKSSIHIRWRYQLVLGLESSHSVPASVITAFWINCSMLSTPTAFICFPKCLSTIPDSEIITGSMRMEFSLHIYFNNSPSSIYLIIYWAYIDWWLLFSGITTLIVHGCSICN